LGFKAYEDTIEKLEHEFDALRKDFALFRDKTQSDVKQGLEI